jgi:hemerythrin-like domain-containing protein
MLDYDRRRQELLTEHELLRLLLDRIADAARQIQRGEALGAARLRTSLPPLGAAFEAHLRKEEALLAPVLERLDAWGPVRIERMMEEHAHQRRELSTLAQAVERGAEDTVVAVRALELVRSLLEDMAAEERDLFDPTQLHDHPMLTDYLGG